jgi:sulfoxide reductase catalytic subunit YedY
MRFMPVEIHLREKLRVFFPDKDSCAPFPGLYFIAMLPPASEWSYNVLPDRGRRNRMNTRRQFMTLAAGSALGGGILLSPLFAAIRQTWGATRKSLAKGTKRESLIHENPAELDTTNLEITPLETFGTMGPTNRVVDMNRWRLEVSGQVKKPLSLTYSQLTDLSSIQRDVLLICPGVFANHGKWKGVSINVLLHEADFDRTATQIAIEAKGQKSAKFPVADVLSDKIFLAYEVNGKALPRQHGFPLRVVAEDYYGEDWVKYVDRITVERA